MNRDEIDLLRHIGISVFLIGLVVLIFLSTTYPYPGSFCESFSTPEMPLRGFVMAWSILGCTMTGFLMMLVSYAQGKPL